MTSERSNLDARPDIDNRIYVHLMSQVSLDISGDGIFRETQERVLKWLFDPERNVKGIPEGAWEGRSFEIDADYSERAAAIAIDKPKYWALRVSERLKDPGRVWTTEVGIAEKRAGEIVFGCRLLCSERGRNTLLSRSIPRFVRGIVYTQNARLDGRPQSPDPWVVDEDNVSSLVRLICSTKRKHPVVVFSLPEESLEVEDTIIPTRHFLRRTAGFVHTAILTGRASYLLSEELGREFAVYNQAIRTYYPNFDLDNDLSSDHPVASPARIVNWGENAADEFENFLVNQVLRPTRSREELEKDHPPFQFVKRLEAERARAAILSRHGGDAELIRSFEEEVAAAKNEAEENLGLLSIAEEEREKAYSEAREIRSSYLALQARVDFLQNKLNAVSEKPAALPGDLDVLEDWARDNLSGAVEIHDRALKACRKSNFSDVGFVYRVLIMLRDFYVPMRRQGGAELKAAFEEQLARLGLENTKCFAQKNKAQSFDSEYFVRYQGEKRELDWHLKGSNARDGRHGFRLYYFWDDHSSRVVVGYFPGHLKNDIT